MVAFSAEGQRPTDDWAVHDRDGEGIVLRLGEERHRLSRAAARELRASLGETLSERRAFVHTVGEHRADGSYAVDRRRGDATGAAVVFDSPEALRALYERLPVEFGAEAVGRDGITGSRRHVVVRHLAEHPAFDCSLASRNPLVARKE